MKDTLEDMGPQFTVNVRALDWPTYLDELRKRPSPFPMFWLGWAPDYADPDNYMTTFLDSVFGSFPYSTGYANTTIDDIIREAAAELDPDDRATLYSEASMLVYEDAPYIWMYQANNFHIERSWVTGYYYNPMLSGLYYAALSKPGAVPDTAPLADAGADQTVIAGDDVTFDGSGSSDDGTIENYTWTFTYDGETRTLYDVGPTFTFDIVGVYVATLNVTDDDSETDEDRVTITVEDLPAVGPTANAGPNQTVTVGDEVTFDGSGSSDDGTIENYTWTFTYDGETRTLYDVDPTFTFDIAGTFDVTLTVTDDKGLTDEDTMTVTVSENDDETFIESYGLALGVGAALIIAAFALFFLMKGGKKSSGIARGPADEREESPPPPV
jgi:PKD repeat protein